MGLLNSYYRVGQKRFVNMFLAYYECYQTNQQLYCYLEEEDFDKIDWKKEPELDFETLMDIKAKHLREKYDVLIFYWSGGTDSHTLWNVFKRNNIHIDRIVVLSDPKSERHPQWLFDWISKNHYDPKTVCYNYKQYEVQTHRSFDSPHWFTKDTVTVPLFQRVNPSADDYKLCSEWYPGKNFVMISGHEKPDLVFNNNTWYTRFDVRAFRQCMGLPALEAFFVDPILQCKQSHVFKRSIKAKFPNIKNGDTALRLYNIDTPSRTALQYHEYATAHGRHRELRPGQSHIQKLGMVEQYQLILNTTGDVYQLADSSTSDSSGTKFLTEHLKARDRRALNYIKGLQELTHDHGFMEYMNKNVLSRPNRLMTNRAIFSKAYDIGA